MKIKTVNKLWERFYEQLDTMDTGNLDSNSVIKKTMNFGFYKNQLGKLISLVELENKKILELGGGIGGLAKMIMKAYPSVSYTMVDNSSMLRFAKDYLATENLNYIDVTTLNDISTTYDLFISVHCLTETPIEYQEFIYAKLFPLCRQVFIIDGDGISGFNGRLFESLNNHFSYIEIKDWPDYPETKLFYARNKKNR
jgi:2-polyprenyl-3-methyl-5-hydroxy-6-metoxy-1,4-benzoquinol methylase